MKEEDRVGRFVAESYDYVPHRCGRRDIEFYVRAATAAGGPALELGCGTGRILIPIARAGVRVIGLDSSAHMVDVCRRRIANESAEVQRRITLIHGDMRCFDLPERVGVVMLPFRSFQHLLSVADQTDCLLAIRRHLDTGGVLIFDVNAFGALVTASVGADCGKEPEFQLPDGRRVHLEYRIVGRDWGRQVTDAEVAHCIAHVDGRRERLIQRVRLRYASRFELEHLLARCGFAVSQVYGDYTGAEFGSLSSDELVIVAVCRDCRDARAQIRQREAHASPLC